MFPVRPAATASDAKYHVTLSLNQEEMDAMRSWARERVQIEFERAEELAELSRPNAHELWLAGYALQVSCVLETIEPAACGS